METNQSTRGAGYGGKRAGAGRKAIDREVQQQIMLDELIFPAVCTAFHAHPGQWSERILSFELSALQIREAYGHSGLREWKSYFTAVRRGGCDRFGNGYQTLWRFNNAKYGFLLKIVRELGHTIKDLPNPGFPPTAMLARLESFPQKQATRAVRKQQALPVPPPVR